ncbi:triose-phosphate isomerase [Lentilitoribacter sp. EG35]|uniref:triose-phosphate isomerase n=1 Tax=Lentilitoribacter sp. EG35 TaxID=3234192 RepID=UPI00345FA923
MVEGKKLWIGTSWKMNKTLEEALVFTDGFLEHEATINPKIQTFVIPPYTCTREVARALDSSPVKVGAQNMHWEDQGAWTGEVSALMLKDCQLDIVELGHSERRAFFNETNETVGLKTKAAVRHELIPLICIGETLAERESGQSDSVLERQVRAALEPLEGDERDAPIWLAYEPVWAIGANGIPATSDYADIRQEKIISVASSILGRKIPCLYGGSVNPDNCAELVSCSNIDGLFIGRSAWNVTGYIDILQRCSKII